MGMVYIDEIFDLAKFVRKATTVPTDGTSHNVRRGGIRCVHLPHRRETEEVHMPSQRSEA